MGQRLEVIHPVGCGRYCHPENQDKAQGIRRIGPGRIHRREYFSSLAFCFGFRHEADVLQGWRLWFHVVSNQRAVEVDMSTIRLFREVQSCQDCLFSWDGYAHGFARGHSVLEKDGRIAFAADDLGYLIPRGDHIEVESQLAAIGWHRLESCPKCGSRRLFPFHYDSETMIDVECLEVRREDLEKNGDAWKLSPEGLARFS